MTSLNRIHVLKQSEQLRSLHAVLRNAEAPLRSVVFSANRLIRRLLDESLEFLPYRPREVATPAGSLFHGTELGAPLCIVSVQHAEDSAAFTLSATLRDLPVGKVVVEGDRAGQPAGLSYAYLPKNIANGFVLLLEPLMATGGSALVAVDVLLNAGVPKESMVFVNLLASPDGLARLTERHPDLTVVTSSVEQDVHDRAFTIPGKAFGGSQIHRAARVA